MQQWIGKPGAVQGEPMQHRISTPSSQIVHKLFIEYNLHSVNTPPEEKPPPKSDTPPKYQRPVKLNRLTHKSKIKAAKPPHRDKVKTGRTVKGR